MRPLINSRGSSGPSGGGTIGKLAKWLTAASLGDALWSEVSGNLVFASHLLPSSDLALDIGATGGPRPRSLYVAQRVQIEGNAPILIWREDDAGLDLKKWRFYADAGGTLNLQSLNDAETVAVNFVRITRGALTAINLIEIGCGLEWRYVPAGHYVAGTDNVSDIGTAGNFRPRDVFIAGEYLQANGRAISGADQATFVNVQTNVTGMSFAIGPNEIWQVEYVVPVTMGVAATGVKFYFTTPVGCTGEISYEGNVATVATWQSLYQAVLTVPGTFFVTGIITGHVKLHATIRNGANAGTIQLVGITGGATTTCAVKKGCSQIGTRIA